MKYRLYEAIAEVVRAATIENVTPDSFIRIDLPERWPVLQALQNINFAEVSLVIGPLTTGWAESVKKIDTALKCHVVTDASELTRLRNEPSSSRSEIVILLGDASGPEQSGLKDLHSVLGTKEVFELWPQLVREHTLEVFKANLSQDLRRDTALAMIDLASNEKITATAVSDYLTTCIDNESQPSELVFDNLWLVDLLPDEDLVHSHDKLRRLRDNSSLIDDLQDDFLTGGSQSKFRRFLVPSPHPQVQAFVRWLRSGDPEDLSSSDLAQVAGALKRPPEEVNKRISMVDFLNRDFSEESEDHRKQIEHQFDQQVDDGQFDINVKSEVKFSGSKKSLTVELTFKGDVSGLGTWADFTTDEEVQTFLLGGSEDFPSEKISQCASFPIAIVDLNRENRESDKVSITSQSLELALEDFVHKDRFDAFIESRNLIVPLLPLLNLPNERVLELLISSKSSRDRVSNYVIQWKSLVSEFLDAADQEHKPDAGIYISLLDGNWARERSFKSDLEDVKIAADDKYERTELLPCHPWRIEPLLELALEVLQLRLTREDVVDSARWAIDRAVPVYRVLDVASSSLNYSTIDGGRVTFATTTTRILPPLTNSISSFERLVGSYLASHPWSQAGAIVDVINAPSGGFVERFSKYTRRIFEGDIALRYFRSLSQPGCERVVDSDDRQQMIASDSLEKTIASDGLERDLVIAFLPVESNNPIDLGLGSHGTIEISLRSDGLTVSGEKKMAPQIQLSASHDNDTVNLLARLGGKANASGASIKLALPEGSLKFAQQAASRCEWIALAVPSAISSFPLQDSDGVNFTQIAEFDQGLYKVFVFARSIDAIADPVRSKVKQGFHADDETRNAVLGALGKLLFNGPQKLFELTRNHFGEIEALGLITAREIASRDFAPDDLLIELSLDDISWSHEWLDKSKKRADIIFVGLTASEGGTCRFVVVESKGSSDDFQSPKSTNEPFKTAVQQVGSTTHFLNRLFSPTSTGLVEKIQLRTLVEQIAAKAGAQYFTDDLPNKNDRFTEYFALITRLTSGDADSILEVSGQVITTYLSSLNQTQMVGEGEGITLVSASAKALGAILKGTDEWKPVVPTVTVAPNPASATSSDDSETETETSARTSSEANETEEAGGSSSSRSSAVNDEPEPEFPALDEDEQEYVQKLFGAIRRHSANVTNPEKVRAELGPTFVTVSIPFQHGAALLPLQNRESDIARDIGTPSVEIMNDDEPGRIRVLMPRKHRQIIRLSADSEYPIAESAYLPIRVGQDLSGNDVVTPLSSWPHALVAGSTGSGKTQFLRSILSQLSSWGPRYSTVAIVDGKAEADYLLSVTPDMYVEAFPEPMFTALDANKIFAWLVDDELPRRKKIVRDLTIERNVHVDPRSLFAEALRVGDEPEFKPLTIIVDEFNDIMIRGGHEKNRFESLLTSIAQTARSVMVHVILATQRPDRYVVPGSIKANLPARVAFRLPAAPDSITVLGHGGAEKLLGAGDMLFQLNGVSDQRLQGYFVG